MKSLKYRRGQPDKPGYWWLWPNRKFIEQTGLNFNWPKVVEVRMQNDIIPSKPELYMQFSNSRLEAWLFTGRVAGPIPEPKVRTKNR